MTDQTDNSRLITHAAIVGLALRGDIDSDTANCSWRSLPDHLQDVIEKAEEEFMLGWDAHADS